MIVVTIHTDFGPVEVRQPLPKKRHQEAHTRSAGWIDRDITPQLAKIAERPEYGRVATLEQRRADTEATVAAMESEIEEVRRNCMATVLDDPKAAEAASRKIEDCQRRIREARLTLEAIAAQLPEALEARERITESAVGEILDGVEAALRERIETADQALFAAVEKPAVAVIANRIRRLGLNDLRKPGVADVLRAGQVANDGP